MKPPATPPENLLLSALSADDRHVVDRCLEPIDLPLGMELYLAGEPMLHAYFPAQGIVSIVSEMDQKSVEIGIIGREGMVGLPLVLGGGSTTTRGFMQVAGCGWRCTADDLAEAMEKCPPFSGILYRYVQALFEQVAQSAACNRLHTMPERLARWLLMVHDRVGDEVLPLKQSFLADMLGVHRPAVTLAAGALQTAGLITYTRGKVRIIDRVGLEDASCPCYEIVCDSFDRLQHAVGRTGSPDKVLAPDNVNG